MLKVVLLPMLHALGLTIVTEGLLVLIITRKKQWIVWSLVCNLLTNPLVNFIVLLVRLGILKLPLAAVVAVLEILVFLSEAVIYKFGIFGKSKKNLPQDEKIQAKNVRIQNTTVQNEQVQDTQINGEQVQDTQATNEQAQGAQVQSAAGRVFLRCLGISLLANACSFGIGELLTVLFS